MSSSVNYQEISILSIVSKVLECHISVSSWITWKMLIPHLQINGVSHPDGLPPQLYFQSPTRVNRPWMLVMTYAPSSLISIRPLTRYLTDFYWRKWKGKQVPIALATHLPFQQKPGCCCGWRVIWGAICFVRCASRICIWATAFPCIYQV